MAAELEAAGLAPELSAEIHAGNAGGLRFLLGQGVYFASLMPDGPERDNEEEDDRQDDDEDEDGDEKLSLSSESHTRL
ncbi:hypothetical protein Y886_27085 [Xanthomonas hyacinthi DSM 19077]|nr:hypothetical protein Y886_27085 [Xanthomonas hyacinthi DSM 19077]